MGRTGMTLVAALMLIVFVGFAVSGTTIFIVQRLSEFRADDAQMRCVYLAQAGIHNAIYSFRYNDLSASGSFSSGQTNIDANNYFVLGASNASDLLMVNTGSSYLYPSSGGSLRRYLYGLTIQNATNSNKIPVVIDRMTVSWDNARKLSTIRINGSNVWTGTASSPVNCDIANFTLNTTPTVYNIDYLQFNNDMNGATINIVFTMTDGSTKQVAVFPASVNYNFSVNSTGKTAGSNVYRTLRADYNALTGKIINFNEINAQMSP